MVLVPLVHLRLRDFRPAERVRAVGVERTDAISGDGQVAAMCYKAAAR
jgi:hypothetical protein